MISFIVPVYNKASVLCKMLSSLQKRLNNSNIRDYEVILVNDGSTDASYTEAVKFKRYHGFDKRLKIFHYTQNVGKGFALQFGFSKSAGDPVVFLDGDLDINTKQVIQILSKYNQTKSDMAIGSKYLSRSRTSYPVVRYLYSLILKTVIRLLFQLQVSDTQVGLKVFRRQVLQEVFPRLVIKRFAMDLELLVVAHMLGFTNIAEIPVDIKHNNINKSTIDIVSAKNFCQDILAIWYRKNILKFYDQAEVPNFNPSFKVQTA